MQKLLNQTLRDFAEISSDFHFEMDRDLKFSYFSDRFEEITGVHASTLLGKTREETGIPDLPPEEFQRHLETLRKRRPFREFVHPRTGLDGRTKWVSINGKPYFDEGGSFLGYRGTGLDITERVQALEELRAAKEEAEYAARTKMEFLANVSHELRTPLNSIIGFSEIMREKLFGELGDKRYSDYADNIHTSGTHLLELINEILDTARVSAGSLTINEEPISVPKLVQAVLTMIRDRARQNGVRLNVDFAPVGGILMADNTRLKQILLNLLSNAVKFTPSGGIVTLRAGLNADGGVRFQVQDTGVGISAADIKRVFEPFAQVQSVFTRNHEGTGLGLPLVKSLTELLGGSVKMESEIGIGTKVTIDLPAWRINKSIPDGDAGTAI